VFLIAEVLGHLFIERGLEHRLGQLFEQPIRPGQRQALFLSQPNQLDRGLLLSRPLSRPLLRHIIQCRHHGTFLAEHRSACQAANTVKPSPVCHGASLARRCHWPLSMQGLTTRLRIGVNEGPLNPTGTGTVIGSRNSPSILVNARRWWIGRMCFVFWFAIGAGLSVVLVAGSWGRVLLGRGYRGC
jgi:hypothetical protein